MDRFFFFLLVTFFLCIPLSCEVDSLYDSNDQSGEYEEYFKPYIKSFMNRYNVPEEKEAFIFFSDPHLVGSNSDFTRKERRVFDSSFSSMRYLYNNLPLEFCLCGGDWLKNHDTQNTAMAKLVFADTQMKNWFQSYYKMMGNHDTNYQGVVSNNDSSRGDLSYDFINSVYFKETGKAYYTIKGKNTLFIILDTGIDWFLLIDDYRMRQIEWLSQLLLSNAEQHVVIGMHMYFNGSIENNNPFPMSKEVLAMCSAFNERKTYDSSVIKCDFSDAYGKVHFVLCGHTHVDFECYDYTVPCVGITRFISSDKPSYDLCLVDYDNGYLDMIRVGHGQSRRIPIAQ